jgi:hypothetical protein
MRNRLNQMFTKKCQLGLILLLIATSLSFPSHQATADIALPPRGVSQELWKAYQEVVISSVGGGDRNLRWNTNPSFYISGNPTASDNNTFQGTLAEIRKYCPNIQPNIVTSEPFEGVILKYMPRSDFKNLISNTPDSAVSSYASYLYYLNRGLTKFTAAVSTETSQAQRDTDTQIRMYQGFGLLGYTKNTNARMFSWMFPNAGVISASELDKQIIRLYCSSYSRSWDTSQQTFDLISSAWAKKITVPSMGLNIKVGEYRNQLNFAFNFDPGQALDNQITGIQYSIFDSAGSLTTSGKLDVSENLFKSHQVVLAGIKDNSRYKIEAFPLNSNGNGPISKGEGRAGTLSAPADSEGVNASDVSAELLDARNAASDSIDAANEAIAAFGRYKTSCVETSLEFDNPEQELFDSTNLSSYCEQLDEKVATLDSKIGALDPDKATSIDLANKLTDQANLYAEDADSLVAQIQDFTDELLATKNQMTSIIKILEPMNQLESDVIETWEQLQERLTILPAATSGAIKKSKGYKSSSTYNLQVSTLIKARDDQLEVLSKIERPTQLSSFISKLSSLKINSSQLSEFKKSIVGINKLIPANVCQKGAAVVLASKSGKCAKGFELIPTS